MSGPSARSDPVGAARYRRPLRLVVVLDTAGVGGAEIVLLNTVRALDPSVVTAELVCLRTEGDLGDGFRAAGVPVQALHRSGRRDPRTLPRLVAALRGADAVLVMHHQRAALTLGRLAAVLAGVRVTLLAVHGTELAASGGRCLPRYVVHGLFLFSALVLLNRGQADYLRRCEGVGRWPWSRVPVRFIANGVPAAVEPRRAAVRDELGLRDHHVVAGVVARLVPEKAHPVLLAAVARLRPTHPRLRLVVVGAGPEEARLRLLTAGYGIADRVVFTGQRSDVDRLLGAFDVFCLTSRTEAAPIAVLEAMTAGLPVVCTDCGALPELVADGREGRVVPVDDDEKVAVALGELVADAGLRERMGAAARERAGREYGIDRTARAYEELLTSLCARGAAVSRVAWYARRMRAMGPAEVLGRSGRAGAAAVREVTGRADRPDPLVTGDPGWEALLAAFRARPGVLDAGHAARAAATHAGDASAVIAAADRARAHRFRFFGLDEVHVGDPVDWTRDPLSGHRWPDVASRRIDHRTTGDPKWIWELNRLQHLPLLAQAWLLTGDDGYADEAFTQLDAWIAAHPPGRGIAWRGAFEAGVRAISVVTALQGLRHSPALTPDRYAAAVRMLDASARRCWRDRSLHSSANNHLVGELAGLALVALAVPELDASRVWGRRALDRLAREADRQILADGSGAEQAIGYQLFTSDLLAVVLLALRMRDARDGRAAATIARALDRGASYLCTLLGDDDPVPRYGDDDEGVALRLDAAPVRTPRAHLATVAALTGHDGAARCGHPDLASAWFARGARPASEPAACGPLSGLAVLRDGGRRVTVDIGPLGYLSLAAHGHADALSVTLAHGGRELVGDPGTGSYYRNPQWRDALRGTRSHATLSVDDLDQSEAGGAFLWTRHAATTVHEIDRAAGVVDAEHDGYRRLVDPVLHRRRVVATPGSPTVAVLDLVACTATHRIRTAWPLPPDLDATPVPAGFRVTRGGACVLTITHAASVPWSADAVRGDTGSGLGWWSSRLEQREPSWLVGGSGRTRGAVTAVVTLLHVPEPGMPEPDVPVVTVGGGRVRACWHEDGGQRRLDVAVAG